MLKDSHRIDLSEYEKTGNELVIVLDNSGRIVFFNKTSEVVLGYSFKEVKNKSFHDLCSTKEEADLVNSRIEEFECDTFPNKFGTHLLTKNGETKLIQWNSSVLLNREDKIDRLICYGQYVQSEYNMEVSKAVVEVDTTGPTKIIQDVEKKVQLHESRKTDERCFWITNEGGDFLDMGESFCSLLGYDKHDLLKMNIADIDCQWKKEEIATEQQRLAAENVKQISVQLRHCNGSDVKLSAQVYYSPMFNSWIYSSLPGNTELNHHMPLNQNKGDIKQVLMVKILDNCNDFIFIHDFNGNFVYLNGAAYETLGYTKDALMGMNLMELCLQADMQLIHKSFKDLIENKVASYNINYLTKDGKPINMEIKSRTMDIGSRKVILTVAKNLTNLGNVTTKYQNYLTSAIKNFCIVNMAGKIIKANGSFCDITGFSIDEIKQMNIEKIIEINQVGGLEEFLRKITDGVGYEERHNIIHKHGNHYEANIHAIFLELERQFLISIEDSLKTEQTSKVVGFLKDEGNKLIESAGIFVYHIELYPERKFSFASPSSVSVIGYTPEELYDNPQLSKGIVYPDDQQTMDEFLQSQEHFNKPISMRWIHKNDHIVWVETFHIPVKDDKGKLIGYAGMARDMSGTIELQRQINRKDTILGSLEQAADIGLLIISGDFKVYWANNVIKRLFGDITDKFCFNAFLNTSEPCVDCKICRLSETGHDTLSCIKSLSEKKGNCRDYKISNTVVKSDDSGINCVLVKFVPNKIVEIQENPSQSLIDQPNKRSIVLRQHEEDILLVNEMMSFLRSCINLDEAKRIITQFLPKLFINTEGSLYLSDCSNGMFKEFSTWGVEVESKNVFSSEYCWAVRRGKYHVVIDCEKDEICGHYDSQVKRSYIDIPVMAPGQVLGLLHLEETNFKLRNPDYNIFTDAGRNMALMIAGQLASVLYNIKLQETIRDQNNKDILTGLFNRRYMEQILDREIRKSEKSGKPVGVILLEIDNYKEFNDTNGHSEGDLLIKRVADFLHNAISKDNIICSFAGEKFGIILPDSSLEQVKQTTDSLIDGFNYFNWQNRMKYSEVITFSCGSAVFPGAGPSTDHVLKSAEMALGLAKQGSADRSI